MALKSALHLLQLIEDCKYDDAVEFVKKNENDSNLGDFCRDLLYKVAYSFGNEDSSQLKLLLVELFRLLPSDTEKYRLCHELLTWRTSPFLTEILLQQLKSLLSADFQEQHPEFCKQICDELPKNVERRLCERLMSKDEDLKFVVTEATHVLAFFDNIPFQAPYRFNGLIDDLLSQVPFEEPTAFPFLIRHAREHPFSPRLLGLTEPTVLIPNVYDQKYLQLRLAEGICDYLGNVKQRSGSAVKPLAAALGFLFKLSEECQEAHASHLTLYMEMFVSILRFIDDIDPQSERSTIMKLSQNIISCIPIEFRVLLLKDIVAKVMVKGSMCLRYESGVLSWLLDQYEEDLNEKVFVDEFGSVLGLLESVTHSRFCGITSFYSTLLRVTRTFARGCVNKSMLAEIHERLVRPIHVQITKCLQDRFHGGETTSIDEKAEHLVKSTPSMRDKVSTQQLQSILRECEDTMILYNCD